MDTSIFELGCMSTRYCDVLLQSHFLMLKTLMLFVASIHFAFHANAAFQNVRQAEMLEGSSCRRRRYSTVKFGMQAHGCLTCRRRFTPINDEKIISFMYTIVSLFMRDEFQN
jgi:hypothetical protein